MSTEAITHDVENDDEDEAFIEDERPEFDLKYVMSEFLAEEPFYCEVSRHVYKQETKSIPTLCIMYDEKNDQIKMMYNPDFMRGLQQSQRLGCVRHELDHFVYGHITERMRYPQVLWNIATDLAINSIIIETFKPTKVGQKALPDCVLVPGVIPGMPPDRSPSDEEKKAAGPLGLLIGKFPKLKSSEYYFERLQEEVTKNQQDCTCPQHGQGIPGNGEAGDGNAAGHGDSHGGDECPVHGNINSFDDHGFWGSVPHHKREYVENKIRGIISEAVREADKTSMGWGSVPHEIMEDIRRYISTTIDWKSLLKMFVGTLVRGDRTTSIKRINRRYPYIHPGIKRNWRAKMLVAIDQSGSVSDELLALFFAELSTLTKIIDVDILPFDSHCNVDEIYTWKKGQSVSAKRTRCGGTDFNAPTDVFNDTKNRGRWDGLLIMTDGCAPAPGPTRKKRAWVLGENDKLLFQSQELVINCSNKMKHFSGPVR